CGLLCSLTWPPPLTPLVCRCEDEKTFLKGTFVDIPALPDAVWLGVFAMLTGILSQLALAELRDGSLRLHGRVGTVSPLGTRSDERVFQWRDVRLRCDGLRTNCLVLVQFP